MSASFERFCLAAGLEALANRGRPVAFALTLGNVPGVLMAAPLLGAVTKPRRLLADKASDADSLRRWLKQRKIRAAIPSAVEAYAIPARSRRL
jgi:hypothetical protein